MADFDGEILTIQNPLEGNQDNNGAINISPNIIEGNQSDISGEIFRSSLAISTHYYLTAICSTGNVRNYWTGTSISFAGAPFCSGGYISGSLTVLGQYTT